VLECVSAAADDPRPLPRTLVVFAHPDDEVVALGARLCRYREALFIYVTDGAPQDGLDAARHGFASRGEYSRARAQELAEAFACAGISSPNIVRFEFPDQTAAFHLETLSLLVGKWICEFRPEAVITHPYEGGHPDHDACALAVSSAVGAMEKSSHVERANVIEAAFYHAGASGIETARFLPNRDGAPALMQEIVRKLNRGEQRRRLALLDCFPSQRQTLQYFRGDAERYRIAPRYDFSRPPHAGVLFYEYHPWGMTSAKFCELACATMRRTEMLCT
jgi:N-acetylglucosamine malate deacetylase 2